MKTLLAAYVLTGALWPWNGGHTVSLKAQEISHVPTAESTCEDWTAWIPPRTEPAILIQAVTGGYMPVQENFVALMEANSGFTRENIYLMCLDKASKKKIAMMGFRCVPVSYHRAHDLSYLWKLRIKVLACLLSAGHSIILSDSDALWLKDPFEDFDRPEVRGSSIVASRGSFPNDLWKLWGSTLCMGFIFFRAGTGTEDVVMYMERLVMQIGDDQIALNFAVKELGITWDNNSDTRYIASTDFGRGTIGDVDGRSLNVTLLPHSRYTRKCDDVPIGPTTTVAHCHTLKDGRSKINWMKEANLWVMDDLEEIEHGAVQGVTLDSRRSSTSGGDD